MRNALFSKRFIFRNAFFLQVRKGASQKNEMTNFPNPINLLMCFLWEKSSTFNPLLLHLSVLWEMHFFRNAWFLEMHSFSLVWKGSQKKHNQSWCFNLLHPFFWKTYFFWTCFFSQNSLLPKNSINVKDLSFEPLELWELPIGTSLFLKCFFLSQGKKGVT